DLVFASLDENHDGVLDEEEIAKATASILAKDQDEDDCVTLDEFNPPEMALPAAVVPGSTPERPLAAASTLLIDGTGLLFGPRLVRRYDRNRDGKLSPAEIGISPEKFARLDTDKDGKLSP